MSPGVPELSVVVPCYRCAGTIADSVSLLTTYLEGLEPAWEVVLVDDGSPDGTGEVLDGLADGRRVRTLRLARNRGKGAAVTHGMRHARGRCRVFTDADLPYRVDSLGACFERVRRGSHAAFGNRRIAGSDEHVQSLQRRLVSKAVRGAAGALLGRHDVDTQCGLKAFSGPLADALFPMLRVDGFLFDVELSLLLTRAGVRIDFVPVVLVNRDESSVRLIGTGARTLLEAWQVWRGRRRTVEEMRALEAFA